MVKGGKFLEANFPGVTETTRVPEPVEFPSIGAGKLVRVSEPGRGLSAGFVIKCELSLSRVIALCVGTTQMTGTRGPSTFPWDGQSVCMQTLGTALSA